MLWGWGRQGSVARVGCGASWGCDRGAHPGRAQGHSELCSPAQNGMQEVKAFLAGGGGHTQFRAPGPAFGREVVPAPRPRRPLRNPEKMWELVR